MRLRSSRRNECHGRGRRTSRLAHGTDRRPSRSGRQERNAGGGVLDAAANKYFVVVVVVATDTAAAEPAGFGT